MEYEVFLLSRKREHYLRHGDTGRAVADGLANTARVITAAAAIKNSISDSPLGAIVARLVVCLHDRSGDGCAPSAASPIYSGKRPDTPSPILTRQRANPSVSGGPSPAHATAMRP